MRTFILPLAFALVAPAQESDLTRRQLAIENIEQLSISIVLNRTAYLPGEAIRGTVTVKNSSNKPVEVPKPFAQENGMIFLQEKGNSTARNLGVEFADVDPDNAQTNFSGQLTTLAPGESIESTIESVVDYEDGRFDRQRKFEVQTVRAGEYRLRLEYGDVFAPFRIEQAPIETWTFGVRSRLELIKEDGIQIAVPNRVYAMVFRSGAQRVLCISLIDDIGPSQPELYVDANGVSAGLHAVTPIRRIAVANVPITNLSLQILQNDGLRLYWNEGPVTKTIDLDKNREQR